MSKNHFTRTSNGTVALKSWLVVALFVGVLGAMFGLALFKVMQRVNRLSTLRRLMLAGISARLVEEGSFYEKVKSGLLERNKANH